MAIGYLAPINFGLNRANRIAGNVPRPKQGLHPSATKHLHAPVISSSQEDTLDSLLQLSKQVLILRGRKQRKDSNLLNTMAELIVSLGARGNLLSRSEINSLCNQRIEMPDAVGKKELDTVFFRLATDTGDGDISLATVQETIKRTEDDLTAMHSVGIYLPMVKKAFRESNPGEDILKLAHRALQIVQSDAGEVRDQLIAQFAVSLKPVLESDYISKGKASYEANKSRGGQMGTDDYLRIFLLYSNHLIGQLAKVMSIDFKRDPEFKEVAYNFNAAPQSISNNDLYATLLSLVFLLLILQDFALEEYDTSGGLDEALKNAFSDLRSQYSDAANVLDDPSEFRLCAQKMLSQMEG